MQRRTLKHDQPRRTRRCTSGEGNRKHAFGNPRAIVRHVELPLDPNGRPIILGVEREPQAIIERSRIAHMRAERSEEGARRPSAFMLFVILGWFGARDGLVVCGTPSTVSLTSFSRRASSASVCGGTYFADTRRRTLVLAVRLTSGCSAST